jgi:hypothetical protein
LPRNGRREHGHEGWAMFCDAWEKGNEKRINRVEIRGLRPLIGLVSPGTEP